MMSADFVVAGCRQLLTCRGPFPKRKDALKDVGVIESAWIASREGRIVFVGTGAEFKENVRLEPRCEFVDGAGLVGLPGFVDAHTHLPFAGNREEEFVLRLKGATYQELSEKGMGIQSTVRATRQASKDELVALCLRRLDEMLMHGTTTVEAKSGYGLNLDDEIKQLEALREAARRHPVSIVPTFMGAHEIPPEYKGRNSEYADFLIRTVMPQVRKLGLAEFFDVFCEQGVFSVEETKRLADAAKLEGFKIRIHADEFSSLGGSELAAEIGAYSADHLISISAEGIRRLAESTTAATLLPGVSFFLMLGQRAPARRLIEEGAVVVLASDFNPGSSMMNSMLFVVQLGVLTLKMSIEEALNAATGNAAYALGRHSEIGSLEPGKAMDVVLWDVPRYPSLVYHLGVNPIRHVIKNGRVVIRDGRLI